MQCAKFCSHGNQNKSPGKEFVTIDRSAQQNGSFHSQLISAALHTAQHGIIFKRLCGEATQIAKRRNINAVNISAPFYHCSSSIKVDLINQDS